MTASIIFFPPEEESLTTSLATARTNKLFIVNVTPTKKNINDSHKSFLSKLYFPLLL